MATGTRARSAVEALGRIGFLLIIAFATLVVVATAMSALLPVPLPEFHQLGPERLT